MDDATPTPAAMLANLEPSARFSLEVATGNYLVSYMQCVSGLIGKYTGVGALSLDQTPFWSAASSGNRPKVPENIVVHRSRDDALREAGSAAEGNYFAVSGSATPQVAETETETEDPVTTSERPAEAQPLAGQACTLPSERRDFYTAAAVEGEGTCDDVVDLIEQITAPPNACVRENDEGEFSAVNPCSLDGWDCEAVPDDDQGKITTTCTKGRATARWRSFTAG